MKNQLSILKNVVRKWIKLKKANIEWYFMGYNCFDLIPPSFYYTHTDEEIERLICELREFIEEI